MIIINPVMYFRPIIFRKIWANCTTIWAHISYLIIYPYSAWQFELTFPTLLSILIVPDNATIHRMLHRERELQNSPTAQRAMTLPLSDRRAVHYQLRLRTVREFGLPDSTVEVLQNTNTYYPPDPLPPSLPAKTHSLKKYLISPRKRKQSPPLSKRTPIGSPTKPVQCVPPSRSSQGASREVNF